MNLCLICVPFESVRGPDLEELCPWRVFPVCIHWLVWVFFSFDAFFIWRSQNPSKFSAELFTCNSKEFRCVFSVSAMLSTSQKANALCCASKMVLICTFPLSVWFCVLLSGPSSTQVLQRPADVFQVLCWREITFMGKGQIFKRS